MCPLPQCYSSWKPITSPSLSLSLLSLSLPFSLSFSPLLSLSLPFSLPFRFQGRSGSGSILYGMDPHHCTVSQRMWTSMILNANVCLSPANTKSQGWDIEFSVNLLIIFLRVCLCCFLSGALVYFPASICVSFVFCCKLVHIIILSLNTLNIWINLYTVKIQRPSI